MSTLINLLRHGEPKGGSKYRGSLDDPLSQEGWRQMQTAVQGHPPWNAIISSPLQRCAAFAEALGQQLSTPVTLEKRLQEMSFGRWEGRTATEIMADDRQRLTLFWKNPLENPPPGGEDLSNFHQRVNSAWHDLLEQYKDRSLLIVAHGGVIRMSVCQVLQMPLQHLSRVVVEYASLTQIRIDEVEGRTMPRLVFHAGRFDTTSN